MGKRQNSAGEATTRDWRRALRYVFFVLAALVLIVTGLYAYGRVDQFLAEDPHFRLAAPPPGMSESPAVHITGATHVSHARVAGVFAADYGRSLYLLPLAERRRELLSIDWVRDAAVSRLWPDRIEVRIWERQPVAYVQLPAAGTRPSTEVALVDAEGVILEMPPRSEFKLPVLTGLRREQPPNVRRDRVAIALRLLSEVGDLGGWLSEIDVGDPEDVRVVQPAEGRALLLHLGNMNFRSRLHNFQGHYPEIQKRLPNATSFDLRLDDRITALGEGGGGG